MSIGWVCTFVVLLFFYPVYWPTQTTPGFSAISLLGLLLTCFESFVFNRPRWPKWSSLVICDSRGQITVNQKIMSSHCYISEWRQGNLLWSRSADSIILPRIIHFILSVVFSGVCGANWRQGKCRASRMVDWAGVLCFYCVDGDWRT